MTSPVSHSFSVLVSRIDLTLCVCVCVHVLYHLYLNVHLEIKDIFK